MRLPLLQLNRATSDRAQSPVPTLAAASLSTAALLLALAGAPLHARPHAAASVPVPMHGVIGVEQQHLTPRFWIDRLEQSSSERADRVLLDRAGIAAQNDRLQRLDGSMYDLRAIPAELDQARVRGWIQALSKRPTAERWDVDGVPVPAATLDAMVDNLALDAIPQTRPTGYGLVVRRAALRSFPTAQRMFSRRGETDIDRLQESALFPGTPVLVAHESADGNWLFVLSPRYAAWIERAHVATGSREEVFGYVDQVPYRIITGATERTVFTREEPRVSQLQLEMGVRVPLAEVAPDRPVNGQHPYSSHVLQLPVREPDGSLAFSPALLPRRADSAADYLPLTPANLIGQGFKFLGERYGWGHAYGARDCSGFVSEVYRSMGVQLPRNTSDQAVSPAFDHTRFGDAPGGAAREAAVAELQVGDLVYIPGHVMMVIGHVDGAPYVIHDTNGGNYLGADGSLVGMALNGVAVTPLLPMMFNERERYVDRVTSVVRVHGGGRE
ncbi:MAG: SH3 domain-containing protein [Proteobacteria bacterium]|nr:SH3 domain-containing protein [Pseudomonadota bacterium]